MTADGEVDYYTMLVVLGLMASFEHAVAGALLLALAGTCTCAFVILMLSAVYADVTRVRKS